MRDLIWTLIVIWLVYRIVNVFKNTSKNSMSHPEKFRRKFIRAFTLVLGAGFSEEFLIKSKNSV